VIYQVPLTTSPAPLVPTVTVGSLPVSLSADDRVSV